MKDMGLVEQHCTGCGRLHMIARPGMNHRLQTADLRRYETRLQPTNTRLSLWTMVFSVVKSPTYSSIIATNRRPTPCLLIPSQTVRNNNSSGQSVADTLRRRSPDQAVEYLRGLFIGPTDGGPLSGLMDPIRGPPFPSEPSWCYAGAPPE